eukprot:gene622-772_t
MEEIKMEIKSFEITPNSAPLYYLFYKPDALKNESAIRNGYPVLLYMHGASKSGSSRDDLEILRTAVIPSYVEENSKWKNEDLPFLVICPQVDDGWTDDDIRNSLKIATQVYGSIIDKTRIYLTGQSMGAGSILRYLSENKGAADEIAAMALTSAAKSPPRKDPTKDNFIAKSNLPVMLFHNEHDFVIPSKESVGWAKYLNDGGINPKTKLIIYPNKSSHNSWTEAYNPDPIINPDYIYDWLLSHTNQRKHQ